MFQYRTLLEIWNTIIIKYPTSPQICHYTTLWNIYVRKLAKVINERNSSFSKTTTAHMTCWVSDSISPCNVVMHLRRGDIFNGHYCKFPIVYQWNNFENLSLLHSAKFWQKLVWHTYFWFMVQNVLEFLQANSLAQMPAYVLTSLKMKSSL